MCQSTLMGHRQNNDEKFNFITATWSSQSTGRGYKISWLETDEYNYNLSKAIKEKSLSRTDV